MKLIIAIVLSLGLANTASAGFGDFFKTKEISKRMLNTVMKNHLIVADVKHPAPGLKLFDACFNGQNFVSKTGTKANRCVEFEYEVDWDRRGDIIGTNMNKDVLTQEEYNNSSQKGYYTPMCSKWEKFSPSASNKRTGKKAVNCRWVQGTDLPFGHYAYSDSDRAYDMFNICDYESVPTTFPLTQTIEVHTLYDNFSDRVYWNPAAHADRAQPGYQKFLYTIPMCDGLSDGDIPDTKK